MAYKPDHSQKHRNDNLLSVSRYMRSEITSEVLPLYFDIEKNGELTDQQVQALQALEIDAARTSILSLASLARINELDHLGGGLDMIPALTMTLSLVDYQKSEFTIENAHTSIGYYSALAARGFLDKEYVIENFRRGLDIAGHVSWVPGGTQLNGGRLGVMIPVAVGQALGKKAVHGNGAWVITHMGDAGWISGQALNGFNGADLHGAPLTMVMHRNGIQLSGSNRQIMDKDPRPIIASLGIEILEIASLHDPRELYKAYHEAYKLAQSGRPSLIYPAGYVSADKEKVTLETLGKMYGIPGEVKQFASAHEVDTNTEIWIPGALMSYRDVVPMLECVFLVNDLPGGAGHHDGHMKGRNVDQVLANPMMQLNPEQEAQLKALRAEPKKKIITKARPATGSKNLVLNRDDAAEPLLPSPGKWTSARAGVEAGYLAVAKAFPENVFVVSCDLDPSTKLAKARAKIDALHQFEMSIEEQASALMANGLAMTGERPQLNVFSTFAAFFEGIAREGLELWRYQRNLNGSNEGLNVTFHMSHVGACTGRDHFSGWSLDWINLAKGYLPYLHRFYAPADARSAFIAVRDLAAHYGGHIIAIPRDNLPVLTGPDGKSPLWDNNSPWEAVTEMRTNKGAEMAILAFGAPAYLAIEASEALTAKGTAVDALVVNGLPFRSGQLEKLLTHYPKGIVTIEDGLIGTVDSGLLGFAAIVAGASAGRVPTQHVGIRDPRIAPADGHTEVWEHFGLTTNALIEAIKSLL